MDCIGIFTSGIIHRHVITPVKMLILSLLLKKNSASVPSFPCYSCEYNYNPGASDACVTNATAQMTVACSHPRQCYVKSQYDLGTVNTVVNILLFENNT